MSKIKAFNLVVSIALIFCSNAFAAGDQSRSKTDNEAKKVEKTRSSVNAETNKSKEASVPSKLNPNPSSDANDAAKGVSDAANGIVNMFK